MLLTIFLPVNTPVAFTAPWAQAWREVLNASEIYRSAAAAWEGAVALVMHAEDDVPARAVYLDLWHGECRAAGAAGPEDLERARFVFEAPVGTWRELMEGRTSPMTALLAGGLRLTRGSLLELLPFASAAKELMAVASKVPVAF